MGFAPNVSLFLIFFLTNHHLWALINDGFSPLLRNLDFHEIKASHVQGRSFHGATFWEDLATACISFSTVGMDMQLAKHPSKSQKVKA